MKKPLEEFLSHPDVSLVTNKIFLKNDPFYPEEVRLLSRIGLHPTSFRLSTDKPVFWIRIKETAKKLGDYHFFEPGGLYRSDLVQAALQIVQRNRKYREARALPEEYVPWNRYIVWYLFLITGMILIFAMVRYLHIDENQL